MTGLVRLLGALALVACAAMPGLAQPSPRQQASDLASELMSPFCPGRLLVDCTSSQAYDLRDEIARRVTAGESVEAVKADLVRQYGTAILGAPPAEGVGLLGWIVPGVLGVLSLAAVAWKVARAARAGAAPPLVPAPAGDAGALDRLDDELRDLD